MTTDVERKVIKQVEYYFGDCNLPRDRFLQQQIKLDNGWVALETMIKFNRLRQITEDLKLIAEALKKSTTGLLEVSDDGTKIRRSTHKPMPDNTEQFRQQKMARTVYVKSFPLDVSLDQLQEFFEQFGEIDNVAFRRDAKKAFKGSVFVMFKTEESVKKFIEAESVKFNDQDLEKRKLKLDYFKEKNEEKKKYQEEKRKKKEKTNSRQQKDAEQNVEDELVMGALLHFTGLSNTTTREDIKNFLQDYGQISWVDFNKGDTECWIKYEQENKANDVLKKLLPSTDSLITLNGNTLAGRVLKGEEEVNKWKQMVKDIKKRTQKKKRNKDRREDGGRLRRRLPKNKRNKIKEKKRDENEESDDGDGNDSENEPVRKKATYDKEEVN